jgi:acyl-CoA synthetase (AMP-forming)/AMP-acid ligase II
VESIVKSHSAVYDCLVVGVPDERFGNRVVALAQLREGQQLALDELKNHCSQSLSGYKVPRELVAVDKI